MASVQADTGLLTDDFSSVGFTSESTNEGFRSENLKISAMLFRKGFEA